jgi:hypothetical protein
MPFFYSPSWSISAHRSLHFCVSDVPSIRHVVAISKKDVAVIRAEIGCLGASTNGHSYTLKWVGTESKPGEWNKNVSAEAFLNACPESIEK